VRAGGTRERLTAATPLTDARYFAMAGKQVFWRAVQCMADSAAAVLEAARWKPSEVDWLVCHQANARIVDQLSHALDIPPGRCIRNIDRVGNTAGASIPIALDHAHRDGRFRPGDRILLTAFGGGLTWGSTVLTWPDLPDRMTHTPTTDD
jgi:3-oxoacyl-[acyl-carrier-protein] synthase-3